MSKRKPIFDLRDNIREQRILTIGIGLGLLLASPPHGWIGTLICASIGAGLVALRVAAQMYWPDRMADDNPIDRE